MAAHRYWQIHLENVSRVSEISFRASIGGANLATNVASLTSNRGFASGSLSNLIDNNVSTAVNVGAAPWTLTYDFGVATELAEIAVHKYTNSGELIFSIARSDDNTLWTYVSATRGETAAGWYALPVVIPGAPRVTGAVSTLGDLRASGVRIATVGRVLRHDPFDGGFGRIAGVTAIEDAPNIPLRRRVRLFDQVSSRLVRETWSADGTGAYSFDRIAIKPYFIVSHDHTLDKNAVIRDRITPEVPV